jgi:glucokinase-like ROK family protein
MSRQLLSGSNINKVKAHNLQAVLLRLLNERSLSRVQLARDTELSNTTITNLVSELIEQGIVTEANEPPARALRTVGRPRTAIRLEPNARYVIGIHIGVGAYRIAITNLLDEILHSRRRAFEVGLPAESVLDQIAAQVDGLLAESRLERHKILGIGAGASGLVDFQAGVNLLAPNLEWRQVPIRDYLQEKLQLPVAVDNNVRAMAIGETFFGSGRNCSSLVFVYGRVGVGAGITFKGEVYRGDAMGAGEIGHTIMLMENGEPCHCGNFGCLETLVSESAILRQAEALARQNPGGIMAGLLREKKEAAPIELVFQAGREGDPQVTHMLEERARFLGMALVNVVNLFNPEMILLGGIFSQGQDLFLAPAVETVRKLSFGGMGRKVRIQATQFGWKAGVVGAAALALISFFYQADPR